MKVKLISDGTRAGTKLVNAETNELIEGARSVTWSIAEVDDDPINQRSGLSWLAKVVVTFYGIEAELEGELSE